MTACANMKVLLMEGIHADGRKLLEDAGFEVESVSHALAPNELLERIKDVHAIGIRSKTQVVPEVLERAQELLSIGAFCIGTNQIALDAANSSGVPVFNAPYSSTRSVAELVIANMVALARQLGDISSAAHHGVWKKSSNGMHEVRGKTVGIIGYGHIGSQVGILAENFGFNVVYHDVLRKLPLGNATALTTLDELLQISDFVTLHVPATSETHDMIGEIELSRMKQGSYLLNLSRGSVVVIPALKAALESGHLAGAAIDVFPVEPPSTKDTFESELRGLGNVILTPHIGGSTEEAQAAIGREVAESLVHFLTEGVTAGAVNFPNVHMPKHEGAHRILNVHRNIPGVLSSINRIVSETGANISSQYLSTDPNIGYLVMDISREQGAAEVSKRLSELNTTIKTRLLY